MTPSQRFQARKGQNRFPLTLLRVIVISFYLSACVYPAVTPTPSAVPTFANVQPPSSLSMTASSLASTTTPLVEVAGTPSLETLTPGPSSTSASPTPVCVAPAGWVRYTIRPGDNLFRLGLKTDTTVEELKTANCLKEELIVMGDALYLPFSPPTDAPIPPTAVRPSLCPSVLCCPVAGLPDLVLDPGGPGNPTTIAPCKAPSDKPWIDTRSPLNTELGQRRYFFACGFPHSPTSATMTLAGGTTVPLTLLTTLPNPELVKPTAEGAVEW